MNTGASPVLSEPEDVLHQPFGTDVYWTRSNVGEAMPGVLTPLGWTVFGYGGELALRGGPYFAGVFSKREREVPPRLEDRYLTVFYGRVAVRADSFALIGDRMPGTSGPAVVDQILGFVPPDMLAHPDYRRAPIIAARFPYAFATTGRRVHRAQRKAEAFWQKEVPRVPDLDHTGAIELFVRARELFNRNIVIASAAVVCAITPMYEQLRRLVERSGVGEVNAYMGGYGSHAETAVVNDLWTASRGALDLAEVLDRHGYHGPREGEISGLMWREDPAPLERMVAGYAARPDSGSPQSIETDRRRERQDLERRLLACFGPLTRPAAAATLRMAAATIPLRGVQKVAFLQSLDTARAAARRIGEHLTRQGVLEQREDVFFLTADEIVRPSLGGARDLVSTRRNRYKEYLTYDLPESWRGAPSPVLRVDANVRPDTVTVTGVGVSPGIAEGIARVITDPTFTDVEDDEILVSPTTDPGWASIMFISKALVVDIGGTMSHAAVIARELGIPCVVNTKTGSRDLRTGDHIRVDGGTGQVELLRRTTPSTARPISPRPANPSPEPADPTH